MKSKRMLLSVMIVLLAFGLAMINGEAVSAKTIKFKIASAGAAKAVHAQAIYTFCKLVKERSNGELVGTYYPASQLGSKDEQITGIKMGTIEMVRSDFGSFGLLYDDISVFNLPYVYRDIYHADRVTSPDSPLFQKINAAFLKKTGVRCIGNIYYGTRHLTASIPVKTPADLKGKKLRVIPIPIWIAMGEGMGAIPTPVDWTEVPTALASGMVIGQENPVTTVYNAKLYQSQKYLMLTGHMKAFVVVGVNEKFWQSLTEKQREIMIGALTDAKDIWMKKGIEMEDDLLAKLKEKGMTIIGPEQGLDNEAFRTRVLDNCIKKFPQWKGYIQEIEAIK